jgi:hypothetical protein
MLKRSGLEGNGVLCVWGGGARPALFGNPYIVKEIKVTECYNKSNIQYGICGVGGGTAGLFGNLYIVKEIKVTMLPQKQYKL